MQFSLLKGTKALQIKHRYKLKLPRTTSEINKGIMFYKYNTCNYIQPTGTPSKPDRITQLKS